MITSVLETNQPVITTCDSRRAWLVSQKRGTREGMMIAQQWPASAGIVANLTTSIERPTRRAHLHISFGLLAAQGMVLWGARFWEEDEPLQGERVDWLLDSQRPVCSVEDALQLLCNRPDLAVGFGCC